MNVHRQEMRIAVGIAVVFAGGILMVLNNPAASQSPDAKNATAGVDPLQRSAGPAEKPAKDAKLENITFGSGCFWCTEAFFAELKGVKSAVSGYSGGHVANPTYNEVCTGATGHAEVVQVTFDPAIVSLPELLEVFWQTHDPTTLNRQGPDMGTQYRSAIFYHTDEQRKQAEHFKRKLDESEAFRAPIVTEITEFEKFYPAEDYHQEYFAANPGDRYCRAVLQPKLNKFRKVFAEKLKDAKGKERK